MMVMALSLSLPSTEALSFGGSKLFQIITPLAAFIILQETPGLNTFIPRAIAAINPKADAGRWEGVIKTMIGFLTWKVGCDFGFLIVNTGAAPWSIAFTWVGLIPYAIVMYVVYYLIGQKMIIQGQLNPFKEVYVPPKVNGRPSVWKQFLSKFFHESLNVTSANVPLRQVTLKPFLDYGAILISWPAYNVALLFSQTGEINFAPFVQFTFLSILVFYIVNVFGFILGFNLGEFLYFRAHFLLESLKQVNRSFLLSRKIRQLWDVFDANSDGSISETEFRQAMRALGQDPSNAELMTILQEVDLDRSGSIEFEEFKTILTSRQDTRRVKLLLDDALDTSKHGPFKRLAAAIALQWQVVKNNTVYIRIQGFLRRYGLNNRWLLSGGLGLLFIIMLEPPIARTLFAWSDRIHHAYYYTFGQLDEVHLAQVLPSLPSELPPPTELTAAFPGEWAAVVDAGSDSLDPQVLELSSSL